LRVERIFSHRDIGNTSLTMVLKREQLAELPTLMSSRPYINYQLDALTIIYS